MVMRGTFYYFLTVFLPKFYYLIMTFLNLFNRIINNKKMHGGSDKAAATQAYILSYRS